MVPKRRFEFKVFFISLKVAFVYPALKQNTMWPVEAILLSNLIIGYAKLAKNIDRRYRCLQMGWGLFRNDYRFRNYLLAFGADRVLV